MAHYPGTGKFALQRAPQPALVKAKRSYVRKRNANLAGVVFPTSPPQLAQYAFNVHGWALEDKMENRGTFEVINAYKATMIKGGFAAKINELQAGNLVDIYRTDLQYTARELDTTLADRDSAVCQYLVVGYTLQEDDPIFVGNKDFSRYSDNDLVGETRPTKQNLISWSECRTPILVVTPVKDNTGTSVRLFGLVQPNSGLCQPVLLTHERIFYRWEFRTSAGAKHTQRNKNWNQLVIEKARMLTPVDDSVKDDDGEVKHSLKRSRSGTLVKEKDQNHPEHDIQEAPDAAEIADILTLTLNLGALLKPLSRADTDAANDAANAVEAQVESRIKIMLSPSTRAIITAIRTSRTDRVLGEVRSLLTHVEMPVGVAPEKLIGLQHFTFTNAVIFGVEEAQNAADEIKELWPELGNLADVDKLIRIKNIMKHVGMWVEARTLGKFLPMALAYLSFDPSITDQALSFKLKEWRHLSMILYQSHADRAINRPDIAIDGNYLIILLGELLRYDEWQNCAMSHSRVAVPAASVGRIFEYTVEFDVNERGGEIDTIVQEVLKSSRAMNCDIEDILLWLERLRLLIRQA